MSPITNLLVGEHVPEPSLCPFKDFVPDGRKAYVVPREHRALVALIAESRRELNAYKPHEPRYAHMQIVEAKARELDALLLELSNVNGVAIEYHADWLYSAPTHEDVVREHEELKKKSAEKNPPVDPTAGLSFEYLERPPEVAHWEYKFRDKT